MKYLFLSLSIIPFALISCEPTPPEDKNQWHKWAIKITHPRCHIVHNTINSLDPALKEIVAQEATKTLRRVLIADLFKPSEYFSKPPIEHPREMLHIINFLLQMNADGTQFPYLLLKVNRIGYMHDEYLCFANYVLEENRCSLEAITHVLNKHLFDSESFDHTMAALYISKGILPRFNALTSQVKEDLKKQLAQCTETQEHIRYKKPTGALVEPFNTLKERLNAQTNP